jgi:uncharacterized protein with GYD domain
LTFGRHDWLVIGEFPDEKAAASAVLAAAAGGSLSDVETTIAMTAKDAVVGPLCCVDPNEKIDREFLF